MTNDPTSENDPRPTDATTTDAKGEPLAEHAGENGAPSASEPTSESASGDSADEAGSILDLEPMAAELSEDALEGDSAAESPAGQGGVLQWEGSPAAETSGEAPSEESPSANLEPAMEAELPTGGHDLGIAAEVVADGTGDANQESPTESASQAVAAESGADAAVETTEAETPAAPTTDPEWLAAFARDLDGVRDSVAALRARWDEEERHPGDHVEFHDAVVAAENEFYGLVDRIRAASHADGGEMALAPAEPVEKKEGFKFDEAPAPGVSRTTTTAKPPKEQTSIVREMIGIVLGGLLAVPIAQMILWWLPVVGKDPLGLGPKMPAFMKFLVPEKFQGDDTAEVTPPTPRGNGKKPVRGPNDGDGTFTDLPHIPPPMEPELVPEIIGEPMPMPDPTPAFPVIPSTPPPPPTAASHPVNGAPTISGDDLGVALRGANEAEKALEGVTEPAKLTPALLDHFVKFCALGHAAAFVDSKSTGQQIPQRLGAAQGLVAAMGHDRVTVERLAKYAASWLKNPQNRKNEGVILAGQIVEIEKQGKLFVVHIEMLDASKRPVAVLTNKEPSQAAGEQVIVLGSIVAEPAAKIVGYQGGDPEVIWAGIWASVASP